MGYCGGLAIGTFGDGVIGVGVFCSWKGWVLLFVVVRLGFYVSM